MLLIFRWLLLLWAWFAVALGFLPFDSPEFCLQNITLTCNTTFHYIDNVNAALRTKVSQLATTDYVRYFKLDLDKQCKFWNAQHFCATENCAVEVLADDQYNWTDVADDDLKPLRLGKIYQPTDTPGGPKHGANTCEDLDYCHIDDGHLCVYVDLVENPERFTGYGGAQLFAVWKAIYSENCFPNTNPMLMTLATPEKCVEKNLFYRLVLGMHALIAVHLSNEYLNPTTAEFYPNLAVFMERVGQFNDRLSNIYFNYALVSQALVKVNQMVPLSQFITSNENTLVVLTMRHRNVSDAVYPFDSDTDSVAASLVDEIVPVLGQETLFDTLTLFNPATTPPNLKNEFRLRFKNILAIMDCVGCDRCRMWGKVQTIGYGTALKILFEDDVDNLQFRRIEIVALLNTFDRLLKLLEAIANFKQMYLQHLDDVRAGKAKRGDYESRSFAFPMNGARSPFTLDNGATGKDESKPAPQTSSVPDKDPDTPPLAWEKFQAEWAAAMDEFKLAAHFVLRSYLNFPRLVWNTAWLYLLTYWDYFLGKTVYVDPTVVSMHS